MTNNKSTKRALFASAMALFLCFTMLLGTTYAWFTDSATSAGNKIVAGTLDVDLLMADANGRYGSIAGEDAAIFGEGSLAQNNAQETLWEPGKTQIVYLGIENKGSLDLKYNIAIDVVDGGLIGSLEYAIIDGAKYGEITASNWETIKANAQTGDIVAGTTVAAPNGAIKADEDIEYFALAVHMKEDADNKYQGKDVTIDITVLATQLASENDSFNNQYDKDATYPVLETADVWDGTADTSWYNDTDTEFTLSTAEALVGLAELIDDGNNFEGKTITLANDIDLYILGDNGEPICFEPIGSYRKKTPFKGTFDGQGHSIMNMSQNTWALDNGYYYGDLGLGLFGRVEDATIKNLVMDGVGISGEYGLCGTVAAAAYGDCTFDNITVKNSQINDYQYYAGGIVGWASGEQTYKNINMDASTTVGSQWGEFGNCNGGIIAAADTDGKYHFEDCVVACRIDATNDVVSAYQWYSYRNSGMLIGQVGPDEIVENTSTKVTADNVTCSNVTVIYGDWANYTYCEFAGTGYPYVRVQAGISVEGYSNVRYGHPTDANGNVVVDDNHVHNDGEDHHMLIAFDQLFGGPANARYCYYGISEHSGVKVVYNNK